MFTILHFVLTKNNSLSRVSYDNCVAIGLFNNVGVKYLLYHPSL